MLVVLDTLSPSQQRVVFALHIDGDVITRIDMVADPGHLAGLEVVILE
jgi:hypothetical protein